MARGGGLEPYGALLLRVFLGVIYLAHAYLALFVFGPTKYIAYERSLHIPLPELSLWYVVLAHGLGGLCLILGILVRVAALANLPVLLGALWYVHLHEGFFVLDPKYGYEYVLFLAGATLAQALLGPGAFTLKR